MKFGSFCLSFRARIEKAIRNIVSEINFYYFNFFVVAIKKKIFMSFQKLPKFYYSQIIFITKFYLNFRVKINGEFIFLKFPPVCYPNVNNKSQIIKKCL
jgi:hypothetical protein